MLSGSGDNRTFFQNLSAYRANRITGIPVLLTGRFLFYGCMRNRMIIRIQDVILLLNRFLTAYGASVQISLRIQTVCFVAYLFEYVIVVNQSNLTFSENRLTSGAFPLSSSVFRAGRFLYNDPFLTDMLLEVRSRLVYGNILKGFTAHPADIFRSSGGYTGGCLNTPAKPPFRLGMLLCIQRQILRFHDTAIRTYLLSLALRAAG